MVTGGGLMQLISFGAQDIVIPDYESYHGYANGHMSNGRISKRRLRRQKNKQIRDKNILKEKKFKNYKKTDRYKQTECVICLEKFKSDEFIIIRKCHHIYHKECDNTAIVNCPICRQ